MQDETKINERFERIERNLDILTKLHLDRDREHEERAAEHEKNIAELREFNRKMTAFAEDVRDTMRRLANIAGAHEDRLDDHDRRLDDLE